jgi:hypothetical protein
MVARQNQNGRRTEQSFFSCKQVFCDTVSELWWAEAGFPRNHTDLEFRCSDGHVSAHRAFLGQFCPTLKKVSDGVQAQVGKKPEAGF